MNKKITFPLFLLLIVSLFATAGTALAARDDHAPGALLVNLEFEGLPAPETGFVYEGWAIVAGEAVSTGIFTVDEFGFLSRTTFLFAADPREVTTFVLTLEPSPDDDPGPSTVHVLTGEFNGRTAHLTGEGVTGTARLAQALRYEITLQNLASGQPISPPVAATHRPGAALFSVGTAALPQLEAIAEDGDASGAGALLRSLSQVSDVVNIGQPLTPAGTVFGDFTDTLTFEIWARPGDRLTVAGMLICTNDGFSGLDRAPLPLRGAAVYPAYAYDAGTEVNTELSADLVDPCSVVGPAGLNGDPNGNENAAVNTTGVVTAHPGISGDGDLTAVHDWDGAIMEVTVTRID